MSTAAWEDVYRLHGERLYRFAYRLTGNPHDAADLVQETFVRALPRLDRLDPDGLDVGAYLVTTEKNLFLKSVARAQRQVPVEVVPEPSAPAPIEDDPERSTLLARQREEVRRAGDMLAPRQRLVLALRELEERSYAEIGELVGLNENAVAQLISRARQRLREELRLVQVDRSRLPAECQGFLPLLSAHLDGQLKGEPAARTLAHLASCEHCQVALADMREASRRYRTLLPLLPDLLGRVHDALAAHGRRARLRRRARLAVGAVAATLVLTGGAVATLASGEPEPAAATVAPRAASFAEPNRPAARVRVPIAVAARPLGSRRVDRLFTERRPGRRSSTTRAVVTTPSSRTIVKQARPGRGSLTKRVAVRPAEAPTRAKAKARPVATPAPTQDVTPPTLVLPAPVTAEATAATGAVVGFDARASDGDTTCTPASGATFALGTTTVTCTARDASGNEASGTFTVTIADTTAPALSLPGETGAQATSAAGATVGYAASAADAVDGAVATSCSPASGSTFPVGTTTVTCSATDAHSNSATGSFQVTVTPLPQPDLVVSAVTGTSFTVANLGTAPAGVFTVAVQGGGVLTFAGLAPGASATRTVACASVQRQVAVDPTNVVAEADEGNNTGRLPAC